MEQMKQLEELTAEIREKLQGKQFLFIFRKSREMRKIAIEILKELLPNWNMEFIKEKVKDNFSFAIDYKGNVLFNKDLYMTNWWGRDYTYLAEINNGKIELKNIKQMKPIKPFPYWFIFK